MKMYRFLVSVAFGLGVMFVAGYATGLVALPRIDWLYALQRPLFAPSFLMHQILGGVYVALSVALLSFSVYHRELRKSLVLLLPAIALGVLWALALFLWQSLPATFALALLNAILWCFLLDFYLRATRGLWGVVAVITAYQLLLCVLSFSLLFLN